MLRSMFALNAKLNALGIDMQMLTKEEVLKQIGSAGVSAVSAGAPKMDAFDKLISFMQTPAAQTLLNRIIDRFMPPSNLAGQPNFQQNNPAQYTPPKQMAGADIFQLLNSVVANSLNEKPERTLADFKKELDDNRDAIIRMLNNVSNTAIAK